MISGNAASLAELVGGMSCGVVFARGITNAADICRDYTARLVQAGDARRSWPRRRLDERRELQLSGALPHVQVLLLVGCYSEVAPEPSSGASGCREMVWRCTSLRRSSTPSPSEKCCQRACEAAESPVH